MLAIYNKCIKFFGIDFQKSILLLDWMVKFNFVRVQIIDFWVFIRVGMYIYIYSHWSFEL